MDVLTLVRGELLWSISEGTKELVPIDVAPDIACHLRSLREHVQDFFGLELINNTQSSVRRVNIAAADAGILQVLFEDLKGHPDLSLFHAIELCCYGPARLNCTYVFAKLLTDSAVSRHKFVTHRLLIRLRDLIEELGELDWKLAALNQLFEKQWVDFLLLNYLQVVNVVDSFANAGFLLTSALLHNLELLHFLLL